MILKRILPNLLLPLLLSSFPPLIYAQQKMLTMEDAVLKQRSTLAPEKLKGITWIPNSKILVFQGSGAHEKDLMRLTIGKPEIHEFLTLSNLNKQLKEHNLEAVSSIPSIFWEGARSFKMLSGNQQIEFSLKLYTNDSAIIELDPMFSFSFPDRFENVDPSPISPWTAFTIDNNLHVKCKAEEIAITKDADKNIVNGKSVHREEFGIMKGTFWSPLGNLLAFYRMDQTMVTDYPVMDLTQRPAAVNMIKYPMAGDKSHEVTVGVFNIEKHTTVFLKTGEPKEQYLTNLAWSPDEKHIYLAVLNRDQNHLWLNSYNSSTGEFEKTLFEEQDEKYVQPLHPLQFVKGHSNHFVWQSKRNGYNNLYLYDVSGKQISQLTGKDEIDLQVEDLAGFDQRGEHIIYQCSPKNNPIGRIIRSVPLKDGTSTTLTSLTGTHIANLSPDGEYFVDQYSSIQTPNITKIYSTVGKEIKTLLVAEDPLKDYRLGKMKVFTLKALNGMDLYCRLILPVDFDSTKKYPVIEYLYGGPGVQLITDRWLAGSDLWFQYMSEHGFIVFTLDNRGTTGRGDAFEKVIFRHLGTVQVEDQMKGVEYLKSLRYVDPNRLGVFGWSFGGFMSTSLMVRQPGTFKVGVAGGPVIDWSYYEVMYTERYMDTPQTNKEGYAESSLLNYAGNLKGKLLMIHGTADDVVVWQHSLLFQKKCVDVGSQCDYYVYPGHLHNVLGKDRVHLYNKVTDYFMMNL